MDETITIGVIGLGNAGAPILNNLYKSDSKYELVAFDLDAKKLNNVPKGVIKASSIKNLLQESYRTEIDVTQSIGKRYRRQDEIGTPYCITVDFDTLNDKSVTIRNRDSMEQERVAIADLLKFFSDI